MGQRRHPEEVTRARSLGASGVGLVRTEHMCREEGRPPFGQDMILAAPDAKRGDPKAREAYYDIDDAIRAGVIATDDLPKRANEVFGTTSGSRITAFVTDVVDSIGGSPLASPTPGRKLSAMAWPSA